MAALIRARVTGLARGAMRVPLDHHLAQEAELARGALAPVGIASLGQVALQIGDGQVMVAAHLVSHGAVEQRLGSLRRKLQHARHIADGAVGVAHLAPVEHAPAKVGIGVLGVQLDGARKIVHGQLVLSQVGVGVSPVAMRLAAQVIEPRQAFA